MIRPEAKEQLWRWREVLVGSGLALLGAWWLIGPGGLLALPAIALFVAGVALIWIGVQRARFRGEGQGPGSVEVDEGQVVYFGPLTGGAVALREVTSITLDARLFPKHWMLRQPGAPDLLIPVNAAGADALFDAFATLPQFRMEHALKALGSPDKRATVIWQRDLSISAQLPLH
jgi:hypothetical protein